MRGLSALIRASVSVVLDMFILPVAVAAGERTVAESVPRHQNAGEKTTLFQIVSTEGALRGVRLHDLRHTHASVALRQGETVLTIARLLGHRNPETTLKYTHLADKMVMDAAETVGAILGQGTQLHPFDASSGSSSG